MPITPSVLVADDEPDLRRILELVLRREGFSVWLASDGLEAVAIYRDHPEIGAVVLDIMMPNLDGISALKELRGLNPRLPCCLCSGVSDSLTADEAREVGNVPFLRKPLSFDEVVRTLREASATS